MNEWFSIYRVELAFKPPAFVAWLFTTRAEATTMATNLTLAYPVNLILDRNSQWVVPPKLPGGGLSFPF